MPKRPGSQSNSAAHLWAELTPNEAPIVAVFWKDIQSLTDWEGDEKDIGPVRKIITIGFLLYDGPDPKDAGHNIVVIAGGYQYDAELWTDYTVFPREVVRDIKPIKPVKGKNRKGSL